MLPVQAAGGSAESGASQQANCLLPVQRVQATGSEVRCQRSPCHTRPCSSLALPRLLNLSRLATPPYLWVGGWLGERDLILAMSEREL